jgi:hypothetical protein
MHTQAVHSDQTGCKGQVGRRVVQVVKDVSSYAHAVVIITHAALLDLDASLLAGWHVAIDEVPEGAVSSGAFAAATTWSALERLYNLLPVDGEEQWRQVVPRTDVDQPTSGQIVHDAAETARPFHRCVLSDQRTVFVDLGDWRDAQNVRRPIRWYSCWTPQVLLQHAASVMFAGAGVMESLVYRAAQYASSGAIAFEPMQVGTTRMERPQVSIHYYTRHRGSTEWWESSEGSRCLVAISRYLESIGFDGFWSGNDVVRPYLRHRFPGYEVSPKISGTNGLRSYARCAIFYSNKAQNGDRSIMEALGVDRDAIQRSREDEDIIQFIFRGRLRDNDFAGSYDIHVYSEDQAQMLANYLAENDVTHDISITPVEAAGIVDVVRPAPKFQIKHNTEPTSAKDRDEKKREAARIRSQRNRDKKKENLLKEGSYRTRGRPRKADNVPSSLRSIEGGEH